MSEDLKKLNYKRGAIKGKITAFQKFVSNAAAEPQLSELQLAELQLRFDKIVPLYDEYDALQTDIEMLSASTSGEDVGEERAVFEDAYYSSMSSAQVLIQKNSRRASVGNEFEVSSANTVVKAHNSNFINLPKINLPRFEGGYQDWLAFRDTYLSLIHNNESINTINKFHYLRASLKGSAALIIQSLDLTCDNYSIAWQLLSERYDNQKLLVANHVNALFNVEPVRQESSQDIPFPSGIILADPKFNEPSSIDILVGAEIFWDVLGVRKIELGPNQPTLRDSKFGWLVCGAIIHPKVDVPQTCMFTHELPSDSGVDISRFWELDSVAPEHKFTPEENACEEHFQKLRHVMLTGKRDSGTYSWLSVALCAVEGESSRLGFSWSQR
ncbi:uncharacterized protein LOC125231965 [Leguminivora glycinivorella]|uniref:uncharacterized protein LOC125231965 n=1 Tax=Leguminivora glycinivorella TaxID=1035111 RepID=UPI00200C6CA6|nr:uncharacterized protein LOC125231965 [Leguminivora glycinivorella]